MSHFVVYVAVRRYSRVRYSLFLTIAESTGSPGVRRGRARGSGSRDIGRVMVGFPLPGPARPIFQTARHSERIDKVRARSLLSQNNPFVRGPGWRRGALPGRIGGRRAPKEPRRRPSCCLCNHPRPSHSHPLYGATLHRVPLAHLIANNRLMSKSGLILKDNWKGIVPTAFIQKNKGIGRWKRWMGKSGKRVIGNAPSFASFCRNPRIFFFLFLNVQKYRNNNKNLSFAWQNRWYANRFTFKACFQLQYQFLDTVFRHYLASNAAIN